MEKEMKTAAIEPNYIQVPDTYKQTDGMYRVIFKQNRPFELEVNRMWYRFGPFEEKILPEDFVTSSEFKQQEKFFTVVKI